MNTNRKRSKFRAAVTEFKSWRSLYWMAAALILALLSLLIASSLASAAAHTFPGIIPLPNGFQPEGIAVGRGTDFYVGSLAGGAIFKGDLRTGEGHVLVEPQGGGIAVGMWVDTRTNYLFVAGGPTGMGHVYDAGNGENVASFQLTDPGTFVNDVVVTRTAAYFTDSFRPFMYKVLLSKGGAVSASSEPEEIPLGGDYSMGDGFNANGIDATPNGKWLVIVNSTLGALYRVDPESGVADFIDPGEGFVPSGDGILLDGKTLYVVQNFPNKIAKIQLSPDLSSGELVETFTDADYFFRIPTTAAEFGSSLYAVNARFDVGAPDMSTEYEVVKVSK